MKNIFFKSALILVSGIVFMTSCNKDLDQFPAPSPQPAYPVGTGIQGKIASTPSDSLYNRLITRSGLAPLLNDNSRMLTMFVTNNAGMRIFINGFLAANGQPQITSTSNNAFSDTISRFIPASTAAAIVLYNTVGQKFLSTSFPVDFPNYALPSEFKLVPDQPFVRLPIFPSRGTPYSFVNDIPVTAFDSLASNGVIHHTFTVVAPPSATLKTLIAAQPTLSYFRAAITRADSGQVNLGRLDSLLNYGVTNMTVLIPNDAAFQTFIFGVAFGNAVAGGATPSQANVIATGAVAGGPAIFSTSNFTTAQVRGLMAYHFLATNSTGSFTPNIRVFTVNIPATPLLIRTLVNGAVAAHPGIRAQSTFTVIGAGPIAVATATTFTGLGTFPPGGAPFSSPAANVIAKDRHAVNGVYHVIDRILLPQ